MIEIELVQGSDEWKIFRKNHITATDSSIIMGTNPFRTKLSLWEEKVFGWEQEFDQKSIDRMQEGQRLEPLARNSFEIETGIKVVPIVAEHDEYNFLSASFDGVSQDRKSVVEIKCGKKSHAQARKGIISPFYLNQLQHQMYLADVEMIFFYSFDGQEGITIIEERDDKFIKKMLEKYLTFWNCVTNLTPPEANNESVNII